MQNTEYTGDGSRPGVTLIWLGFLVSMFCLYFSLNLSFNIVSYASDMVVGFVVLEDLRPHRIDSDL